MREDATRQRDGATSASPDNNATAHPSLSAKNLKATILNVQSQVLGNDGFGEFAPNIANRDANDNDHELEHKQDTLPPPPACSCPLTRSDLLSDSGMHRNLPQSIPRRSTIPVESRSKHKFRPPTESLLKSGKNFKGWKTYMLIAMSQYKVVLDYPSTLEQLEEFDLLTLDEDKMS